MFKKMIALVFLLAFAMQTFSRTFIVLDYLVNTKSFAKNCENKAKPKMHCNGKCQMMKKLKEQEKKDQQFPERKTENKNEVLSSKSFFLSLDLHTTQIQNIYFNTIVSTPVDKTGSIFHPPQV